MKRFTIFNLLLVVVLTFQLNAQITLDLKVFLEGPFNGTTMNTNLNVQNLIPLTQPYNVSPWNYNGTEQASSIPNPDIVDWVLIELRETSGDASTATADKMINRQAAFVKANGNIVGTNGSSMITYIGSVTGNLYVIIWHRNHLAIMSSESLTNAGGIYSWDFTDQLAKVYLDGQKQLGTNAFGMYGGDSDANGIIETADKYPGWDVNAGTQSYAAVDLNLDSQVNNPDKDNIWHINLLAMTKVPATINPLGCGYDFVDPRDGKSYSTVQIGDQCWMAENLNIGNRIDGIEDQTDNAIVEKYCYNNDEAYCDTYGGLYQWNEMMEYSTIPGVQGICPANWHLPSDAEWTVLTTFLGGGGIAGGKMKATGTIEGGTGLWHAPNNGATNESGFTALPGGERYNDANFYDLGYYPFFWSSEENNLNPNGNAWSRYLFTGSATIYRSEYDKAYGFSVRCVKDTIPTWSCGDVLIDERDSQTYNTVQISDQCWMAENLNIGNRIDGIEDQTDNTILEKYCFDNLETNCDTYGGLYQWNEMMEYNTTPGVQGICPAGWHLPTDAEWIILTAFLGGENVAGGKMKETGTIEAGTGLWYEPNTGATNESGFSVLPGGIRFYDGGTGSMGYSAFFWSSTEGSLDFACKRYLYYDFANVFTSFEYRYFGYSSRCVQD